MEYIEKCKKEFCPTCNFYGDCKAYKEDEMCDQGYWEFLEQQLQEKDKVIKEYKKCMIKKNELILKLQTEKRQ